MTQGYGPDHGQQPQWGQAGQNPPSAPQPQQQPQWGSPEQAPPAQPQWGQPSPQRAPQVAPQSAPQSAPQFGSPAGSPSQPQWGQASPAGAPGAYPGAGYPGAAGASGPAGSIGSTGPASTVAKLIQWMFYATLAVIAVRLIGNVIVFAVQFAGGAAGSEGLVGAGGVLGLLVLLVNGLVTLALLVLAVMVIIQASGRGRTGAIIIIATVVLSVITYWILRGILFAILINATEISTVGVMSLVYLVAEIIRVLIIFAVLIVGALMSRRWAKQNA